MITESKVIEIFCIADDFCKEFETEMVKKGLPTTPEAPKRNRKRMMSDSVIHNQRQFNMKVFKGVAEKGKSNLGWYVGF